MGMAAPALRFLIREHQSEPLRPPVLTLGRQTVLATRSQVLRLFAEEKLEPQGSVAGDPSAPCSDQQFFQWLGLPELLALDVNDFEGATLIADLNSPVPPELHQRFGTIIDGGTLEHIFDIREGLRNVVRMLRTEGRVLHMSPSNNYCNHGFYQFSPTLFFDYYLANDLVDVRGYLVEQNIHALANTPLDLFTLHRDAGRQLNSAKKLCLFFQARKGARSREDQVPTQYFYDSKANKPTVARSWKQILKAWMPISWKVWLQTHIPGLDPHARPWQLTRAGRLEP